MLQSHTWFSISICTTAVIELFSTDDVPVHNTLIWSIYMHIVFFMLMLTVVWIMVFENSTDIDLIKVKLPKSR